MLRLSEKDINEEYINLIINTLGKLNFINYSLDYVNHNIDGNVFDNTNSDITIRLSLLLSFNNKPFIVRCNERVDYSLKKTIENSIYRDIRNQICNTSSLDYLDNKILVTSIIQKKFNDQILDIIDFLLEKIALLEILK